MTQSYPNKDAFPPNGVDGITTYVAVDSGIAYWFTPAAGTVQNPIPATYTEWSQPTANNPYVFQGTKS